MTDEEFIDALVAAKKPDDVFAAMQKLADAASTPSGALNRKADQIETLRQQREGIIPQPMESGQFFQNLLRQGGGRPIPLS